MTATDDNAPTGTVVQARYHLRRRLGAGGMGDVWQADDLRFEARVVAIKLLTIADDDDAHLRARRLFHTEANVLAALKHEHIAAVTDYGEFEGQPFLVMEFVDGQTLRERLRQGPMPADQLLRYADDLCAALAYAHAHHVVHRDVKPANLIIQAQTDRLVVVDFGIARRLDQQSETTAGVTMGTLNYMAPEQLRGEGTIDHRVDIFSVGSVFYEMAAGAPAFAADNAQQVMQRVLFESPVPLPTAVPGVDAGLARLIDRMLQKDPAARPDTLDEVRRTLAALRVPTAAPGRRVTAWMTGLTAVVIVATSALWLRSGPRDVVDAVQPAPAEVAPAPRRIDFTFQLERDLTVLMPSANRLMLRKGDRFRVQVTPGEPGHLYAFSTSSQSDRMTILFPSSTAEGPDSALTPSATITFPRASWFGFAPPAGAERVWLVWTREPQTPYAAAARWANEQGDGEVKDATERRTIAATLSEAAVPLVSSDGRLRLTGTATSLVGYVDVQHP